MSSARDADPPGERPSTGSAPISQRKSDHLEVAASGSADFRRSTLLEQVTLVHQALPELAEDEIDLRTEIVGRELAVPLVVSGMTGGTDEAGRINRDLARAAERAGAGFGVGSQRAMSEHPELEHTFRIRDAAPDVFLIGNVGVVQAREYGARHVGELAARIGADAMAVHLNPAMELIQADGDRDFRGAARAIGELVEALPIPVIIKETGCGLSPQAARTLRELGVAAVDVSGAGGTSWVAVEARRAAPGSAGQDLGHELWDWGLPTAVSTAACAREGLEVIATGGLRSGHDVARAIALGARCGGMAAPMLRAQREDGERGAKRAIDRVTQAIRTVTLLCGARRAADLATAPRHIGAELSSWLRDLGT